MCVGWFHAKTRMYVDCDVMWRTWAGRTRSLWLCGPHNFATRLQQNVGVIGAVLQWLTSFLSGQLRQLRPLIRSTSSDAAMQLVQAFISTRLDYCNSLLYGISDNLYQRLQAVQNAATRFTTNMRRCEHITPVLQQASDPPTCNSRSLCWRTRH